MPTWSGILNEINETRPKDGPPDLDGIRRRYLAQVHQHTGRNIILYASMCTQHGASPDDIGINDEDIQGLMEVCHGLPGDVGLDLIMHSPGGSVEAAEAFVNYLRSKFKHIRVIVPQVAMSAATMIACSADTIVLGKHSSLGPTEPQLLLDTPLGRRFVPAHAIKEQYKMAQKDCTDPKKLAAWLPMLGQYGPDLLNRCDSAISLSEELIEKWLKKYMFKRSRSRGEKAKHISRWLSKHSNFKSHSRHIPRYELKKRGLKIEDLESDQQAQDLFLSIFHTTTHTFSMTPAVKIIENHNGKAHIKLAGIVKGPSQVPIPKGGLFPTPQNH